ncbi:GGDEF domain-containing protein [Parvularcula dongshanensis]|uniref:diguanylate cyclase n=1 Tax=Parvularcula dongshanensis TaxID=1173995 RepID=A0A840I2R1_9PROT|nr:GGDEF domain-containing protein [Parvularcula dongshanensis]MBB4658563.1 diguanylate cyclase (GGDEF)-like protein [Parvularcula dongshanensis]
MRRFDEMELEIALLKDELARAERRIEELNRLADRDALTGVLNRRAFAREMTRTIAAKRRHGSSAMLVTLDVEGLDAIAARHGHAACDAVLAHLGETILTQIRSTDAAGRLGGDEFALLLAFADQDGADRKMRRLTAKLSELPFSWNGQTLEVGVRYAMRPVTDQDVETQLSHGTTDLHNAQVVMRVIR